MIGKVKIFNIANMDLNNADDIDKGIELLKGVRLKLRGGKRGN